MNRSESTTTPHSTSPLTGDEVTLSVEGGRAHVRYGASAPEPTAELTCTTDDFFALLSGAVPCEAFNPEGVRGNVTMLQELMDTIRSTLAPSSS